MKSACCSIEDDADFEKLIAQSDTIAFCYPIYFSRVPRILREFVVLHLDKLKGKKIAIFCTQQILSGDGTRAFTALLPKNYADVIYTEHFFCPSNIWPVTTSRAKIEKSFARTKRKMQAACQNIKNGKVKKRGFGIGARALGLIQAPLALPIERKANKSVRIADDCTKCGVCVKTCPMNNFALENKKAAHKNNCTVCYRCVNECPQKAITVVFHGKVRKQYKGI